MTPRLHILGYYLQSRYLRRFKSRAALEGWQERQVGRLLRAVVPRSRYTRQRLSGHPLADWRAISPMEKADMMAHFDDLNTVGVKKEDAFTLARQAEQTRDFTPTIGAYTVGLSSGTSGNQGLFIVSPQERWRWAGAMLARVLPGSMLAAHRVAFFLRANSNLYTTVGSRRLAFHFFDLHDALDAHLNRLQRLQPTLVVAPPSMLRLLAEAVLDGRLTIRPVKVVSVAEVLDPVDARLLREAFQQTLHQIYQATEGFLGVTCTHGTLHLNEDLLIVERAYLDPAGRTFVPILTDLYRTTQPIIRYRLNDLLTERTTPCPCGSVMTALERVDGRCDDLFYLVRRDGTGWLPLFPDLIRGTLLALDPAITAYLVRQVSPEQIDVLLEEALLPHLEAPVAHALTGLIERQGGVVPSFQFKPYPRRQPPSTKLRRIQRCFDPTRAPYGT